MRPARAAFPLVAALLAGSVASCGGSDAGAQAAKALPQVHLSVTAPGDTATTRAATVTVRGTVDPPGAAVSVLGRRAEVVGSRFTAQVALDPGANVIDLQATAPRRDPAMTAFRVTRELLIEIPDLSGLSPDNARKQVQGHGLRYEEHNGDGFLDGLLPGSPGVCEQDPAPGKPVTRGTTVKVLVAKRC
jgi:PASTA domain-containing protein/glucodextranase-like protein